MARATERSTKMPKRRIASAVKLIKCDSLSPSTFETPRNVNFCINPVRAAHIDKYRMVLPILICHGINLNLDSGLPPGNKKAAAPNSHWMQIKPFMCLIK